MKWIKNIFILLPLIILLFGYKADNRRVMAHMESEKLVSGKKIIIRGDVFYSQTDGKMVVHYTYPQDYFFVSNAKGEVQLYLPESNKVMIQRNPVLSSQNDVLYYFFSNKISDLGLKDGGFTLTETKVEDRNVITTWSPPSPASKKVSKVEMVHQDFLPIYTAYYDLDGKVTKKVYYSKYYQTPEAMFPQLITEIEYIPTGDSIISRKRYSDIKTGFAAQSQYFDFNVPGDAKLVTFDENFGK